MIREETLFPIGHFAKPHGVKGELALHTSYAELLERPDDSFLICSIDGIFVPFYIESLRSKSSTVQLVKLEDVTDEPTARSFVGKTVYCPAEWIDHHPATADNASWLIGFTLVDSRTGEVGEIVDIDDSTLNTLLKVDRHGRELLVPVAEPLIVAIDRDERRLEVTLPDGLIELYES